MYWMDCFYGMNGECGNFACPFLSYTKADIINLTNNELKIRRTNTIQEGDETFTINTIELTYIPAP